MDDEAHVRLVDAHAKRNGGDHDDRVLAQETLLVFVAHIGAKARMVGQGSKALGYQMRAHFLDAFARETIDNACLVFV